MLSQKKKKIEITLPSLTTVLEKQKVYSCVEITHHTLTSQWVTGLTKEIRKQR